MMQRLNGSNKMYKYLIEIKIRFAVDRDDKIKQVTRTPPQTDTSILRASLCIQIMSNQSWCEATVSGSRLGSA